MSTIQETTVSSTSSRGRRGRYSRPRRRGGVVDSEEAPQHSNALPAATESILPSRSPPARPGQRVMPAQREGETRRGVQGQLETQRQVASGDVRHNSRSGRGARGGRRGGAVHNVPQRTFGGQLTNGQPSTLLSSSNPSLQPDAPEFMPGQPLVVRNEMAVTAQRPRRMSKSAAPDISTRIHEDVANRLYECAICTSEVLRNSKIWSCKTCWTVFHLSCITKWSKNEGSTQQRQQEEGIPLPRQWRCPGCNLPKDDLPGAYTCWCGKEVDPKPVYGSRPHSCGQTCGKMRASRKNPDQKCPHPCEEECHAGPCPPCTRSGPIQPCYCGKDSIAKRCVDTDYGGGSWSCGRVCDDLMPCGEHTCPRGCHEGLCGGCEVPVESQCYCGKVEQTLPCSDRGDEKESRLPSSTPVLSMETSSAELVVGSANENHQFATEAGISTWIGSFTCELLCKRPFDCGKHKCSKGCHEQIANPPHCPLSPDVINHCPCGKTFLSELNCERTSCEDPIPHCEKICEKSLSCGHLCPQKCHVGECRPCMSIASIKCRCYRTSSKTICHQGVEEPPQCMRTCKAVLNCGRHECAERCCPAEKAASDRQAAKRKMRLNSTRATENDFEAEHICTRTCGRPLKCGNDDHTCQELCHRGPCGSCREAIFDEIACNCGRTVLQPPLPCGTQPPTCQYPCRRHKPCGHPVVAHPCHEDDACPKCPYLVQKTCMCEKSVLKNQPCWSTQVSCGQPCGRRLTCGIHFCQKNCHRDGDCEDGSFRSCPQTCGQRKTACEHFCLAPCHAPYACKEDKPCQSKIIITCDCGRIKQEARCLSSKGTDNSSRKFLPCDDECLRLARNHKLAQALNVDPQHIDSDHIPYSSTTLDFFQNDMKWSQVQEREFRVFAADDMEKRLRFKPMKAPQRAFLHALAEDFGLDTESLDPEPHRHIIVFKTPRFVSAPMKTLAQCVRSRAVEAPAAVSKTSESGKPYNALILSSPRFALTLDELRAQLASDFKMVPNHTFSIAFLPSEEVVIHETTLPFDRIAIDLATISRLQGLVSKTVSSQKLASSVSLCRVDQSLNVLRRETDATTNGWSQVVKGATLKSRALGAGVGAKSSFTVLGTKASSSRAKEKESVVENWENAMDGWD